ncbi:Peptidase S24-like [Filimonas lacunae]|uniref:Peptidase S24-like n=3 Tax=Filimonas lacunae TaxID=477680 RepID=A0A1N7LEG2_9BACT|nr:Peptidase S24-like [Filimonas lacunae]
MLYLKQNLKWLREQKGLIQQSIADILGIKKNTYANYETGYSSPDFLTLKGMSDFFQVSADELLYKQLGVVESKKAGVKPLRASIEEEKSFYRMPQVITVDSAGNENVMMVPVKARAGYLNGYEDPEYISTLPTYRLPGLANGTYRMFEVEGVSMYPTFDDKDILIAQFVDDLSAIRDDRIYVVVTVNDGVVVKRVLNRILKDNRLILKSDNYKHREEYPPIIIDPQDVLEMWYGVAFMSRQMRAPAELYTRVSDTEARLTLLESELKKLGTKLLG